MAAVTVTHIDAHKWGWVYFYDGVAYLEGSDFRDRLGGNAVLIVERETERVLVAGTAPAHGAPPRGLRRDGRPSHPRQGDPTDHFFK